LVSKHYRMFQLRQRDEGDRAVHFILHSVIYEIALHCSLAIAIYKAAKASTVTYNVGSKYY
jgi:hypothetical protein